MAKPKFELTAELVKVEPEPIQPEITREIQQQPVQIAPQRFSHNVAQAYTPPQTFVPPKTVVQMNVATSSNNIESPFPQPEIEREAISMKISKNLKKSFHLWCVQRGITMTDAIEAAIKKYLEKEGFR
jgi:hypothetical protein